MRHYAAQKLKATQLQLLPTGEAPVLLMNVNIATHLATCDTASLPLSLA